MISKQRLSNKGVLSMKRITLFGLIFGALTAAAGVQYLNTSGALLGNFTKVKCGAGLTCSQSAGVLTMVSSPSPTGSTAFQGAEATDAYITLQADESDDNGDDWKLTSVASGNSLTISNDTSGSQVAKFTMTTAGNISLVGSLTGDGGDALSGFLQSQVASTTTSLTAAQCGSTIVSNSADVVTLPEASTVLGCRYTFVCGTADDFDVNPADGTDQIGPALNSVAGGTGAAITPSAGDAIRCTDIGSSITLEAVGANLWAPIGVGNGAWTDVD
jgi:hypothetical protein